MAWIDQNVIDKAVELSRRLMISTLSKSGYSEADIITMLVSGKTGETAIKAIHDGAIKLMVRHMSESNENLHDFDPDED